MTSVAARRAPIPAEQLPLGLRIRTYALLMAAEFLYGWSWSTVDTLRPQLRASVDASLPQIGALYSVQAVGALIGAIFLGQLGDRLGRRNVLCGVLVAGGAVLVAGAFIDDYAILLVQRFMLGLALGGVQPLVSSCYLGLFPARVRGKLASGTNAVFTLGVMTLGAALGSVGGDWRTLLWLGGGASLVLAPVLLCASRDDRDIASYGHVATTAILARAPLPELITPALRRLTLTVALMAGCNYFATQAFQGWTSTFLATDRGLAVGAVGSVLAWQAAGSLIGGFFWGWSGDRFGRRHNVVGYLAAAGLIAVYVLGLDHTPAFEAAGFAIGFGLAASVIWAPWVAELFPDRLRATALSIFNWGRIVSLFAPLTTGAVAEQWSLAVAMLLAIPALLLVIVLWRTLPETARL